MALADPQGVNIATVAQTLPRVSTTENSGTFRKDDGTVELKVSHTYGKRNRRAVRLNHNKVDADPLVPTVNVPYSMSVTLVIDAPKVGYTNTEILDVVNSLTEYLRASSSARVSEVLGGQS